MENDRSSSDEMIDIQIEESLGRETLMAIDSANFRDEIFSIGGFIIILVISTMTGFFGPKPFEINNKTIFLSSSNDKGVVGTRAQDFSMTIKDITPYYKFVSFNLVFTRGSDRYFSEEIISYNYKITLKKNNQVVNSVFKFGDNVKVVSHANDENSIPLRLFSQRIIDFDSIIFEASVDVPTEYNSITLNFVHGYPPHTLFQIYFKIIFAIIELGFFIFFILRLSTAPLKYWHLEQKLTCPLLLLAFLYNNIFEFILFRFPTTFMLIIEILINCMFSVYLKFFILVLFDSLRYKNRKTDNCFFIPKIAFSVVMYIFSIAEEIYNELSEFAPQIKPSTSLIRYINIVIMCAYICWAGFSVIISSFQVDITERYKYIIYITSGITSIALMTIYTILFNVFGFFAQSAIRFVGFYSIQNVFVMLMTYFHWPYEVLHDQDYINGENAQQGATPGDFFVNDESN